MNKNVIIFVIMMTGFALFFSNVLAQPEEESEGQEVIDPNERGPEWKYANYPVTTDVEATYDVNHNGILEPDETRNLLQERYDIIQTQGSTGVDADLLQQYDANGDGSIDAREAEEIREDMQ